MKKRFVKKPNLWLHTESGANFEKLARENSERPAVRGKQGTSRNIRCQKPRLEICEAFGNSKVGGYTDRD